MLADGRAAGCGQRDAPRRRDETQTRAGAGRAGAGVVRRAAPAGRLGRASERAGGRGGQRTGAHGPDEAERCEDGDREGGIKTGGGKRVPLRRSAAEPGAGPAILRNGRYVNPKGGGAGGRGRSPITRVIGDRGHCERRDGREVGWLGGSAWRGVRPAGSGR